MSRRGRIDDFGRPSPLPSCDEFPNEIASGGTRRPPSDGILRAVCKGHILWRVPSYVTVFDAVVNMVGEHAETIGKTVTR